MLKGANFRFLFADMMGDNPDEMMMFPTLGNWSSPATSSSDPTVFKISESVFQHRNTRNFVIGIIGLVANLVAIVVIIRVKKVKLYFKMYLTSLAINDTIFMGVLTIPMWNIKPADLSCAVIALGSLPPFAVSSLMSALTSCHNYLLVFYVFKFRTIITARRAFYAVVAVWLASWSLDLMCIRSIAPQTGGCSPPLKLPKFVYITSATINAVSTILVMFLNFRVVCSLRSGGRVRPVSPVVAPDADVDPVIKTGIATSTSASITPVSNNFMKPPQRTGSSSRFNSHRDSSEPPDGSRKHSNIFDQNKSKKEQQINTLSSSSSPKLGPVIITPEALKVDSPVPDSPHYSSVQQRWCQGHETSGHLPPYAALTKSVLSSPLQNSGKNQLSVSPEIKQKLPVQYKRLDNVPRENNALAVKTKHDTVFTQDTKLNIYQSRRQAKLRKLSISLCIITLWSCFLNFPNFVCTILSVSRDTDKGREELDKSDFNMISTTLLLINCLCNPFIYAWRFVDWSHVCFRIRQCFF